MKENDLDKTKPIQVLSTLTSREDKYAEDTYEEQTRTSKYQDALEKEEQKREEEQAEEALAEKNIALAEALLEEEKVSNDVSLEVKTEEPEKKKLLLRIKEKWENLEKKQKIMFIIIALLVLALLVIFVVFLVGKLTKEEEPAPVVDVKEEAPIIADNFYYKSGKLYFLDADEKEIGSYTCENQDSNLCYVAYNTYRDNFDVAKLEDEAGVEKVKRIPIYEDRYVFVVDNEDEKSKDIKLYSMADNKVLSTYHVVKSYDDNYVVVSSEEDKYGLIQIEDGVTEVIAPTYDYLGMIEGEDNLIAKNKKGYVVINKKNKVLSSTFGSSYEIKSYNGSFVVAKVGGEYNLYDYKAALISGGYDYISVRGKYAALVDAKNHVTVIGSDKTKYNEGGLSLRNSHFIKTYVYDKEDNLLRTERSFEWTVKEETLEFAIYEDAEEEPEYETIDLVDGLANKKYKYVSSFDGKLYFYKDEAKQELLGSYSCSSMNYIIRETDTFDSCFVAKDTIYEDNDMMSEEEGNRKAMSPLINDTFVFISDGNNEVKLFNLVENKIMGTYASVNTYTSSNDYTFYPYNGKVTVVAVNKKGKYGMLTIDGTSVKATYAFDYNRLEKLGEYYLAQDTNNQWKILFGDTTSVEIPGKILGYSSDVKHYKAKVNNAYAVYNNDGTAVGSGYAYVELYSTYYAAVNSQKELYIYNYEGEQLTQKAVSIGNYPYTRTSTPAFKVKKEGNGYLVSVYDGSGYTSHTVTEEESLPVEPPIE